MQRVLLYRSATNEGKQQVQPDVASYPSKHTPTNCSHIKGNIWCSCHETFTTQWAPSGELLRTCRTRKMGETYRQIALGQVLVRICESCNLLLHPAPTSAQDRLDPCADGVFPVINQRKYISCTLGSYRLQLVLMVFFYANYSPVTDVHKHLYMDTNCKLHCVVVVVVESIYVYTSVCGVCGVVLYIIMWRYIMQSYIMSVHMCTKCGRQQWCWCVYVLA